MLRGIYTSVSGMLAYESKLDVITNNLANASSTGYKRDIIYFDLDQVQNSNQQPGIQLVSEMAASNSPVLSSKHSMDFSEGSLQKTDNPLDVALEGSGFFVVQTPNGIRYTRNGNFSHDLQGQLTTREGFPVLGISGGPINVSGEKVEINASGDVSVDGQVVDRLRLADFQQPSKLLGKEGNGLFKLIDPTVQESPSSARVWSGHLESSNVSVVSQMAELIETYRGFETYQKAVQFFDETIQKMQEIGRV